MCGQQLLLTAAEKKIKMLTEQEKLEKRSGKIIEILNDKITCTKA